MEAFDDEVDGGVGAGFADGADVFAGGAVGFDDARELVVEDDGEVEPAFGGAVGQVQGGGDLVVRELADLIDQRPGGGVVQAVEAASAEFGQVTDTA